MDGTWKGFGGWRCGRGLKLKCNCCLDIFKLHRAPKVKLQVPPLLPDMLPTSQQGLLTWLVPVSFGPAVHHLAPNLTGFISLPACEIIQTSQSPLPPGMGASVSSGHCKACPPQTLLLHTVPEYHPMRSCMAYVVLLPWAIEYMCLINCCQSSVQGWV